MLPSRREHAKPDGDPSIESVKDLQKGTMPAVVYVPELAETVSAEAADPSTPISMSPIMGELSLEEYETSKSRPGVDTTRFVTE